MIGRKGRKGREKQGEVIRDQKWQANMKSEAHMLMVRGSAEEADKSFSELKAKLHESRQRTQVAPVLAETRNRTIQSEHGGGIPNAADQRQQTASAMQPPQTPTKASQRHQTVSATQPPQMQTGTDAQQELRLASSVISHWRGETLKNSPQNRGLFRNLGTTVLERNREFKNLVGQASVGNVETDKDKGVLWSGDTRNKNGGNEKSAMLSGQQYARDIDGKTVEMTQAGVDIESHISHEDMGKRFAYLYDHVNDTDPKNKGEEPEKDRRRDLIKSMMKQGLGENFNKLSEESRDSLGTKRTAGGEIWDVISERFAAGLRGKVTAVHARNANEYLDEDNQPRRGPEKGDNPAGSTYIRKEKPRLLKQLGKGVSQIVDKFNDEDVITKRTFFSSKPKVSLRENKDTSYIRGDSSPRVDLLSGAPLSPTKSDEARSSSNKA